MQTNKKLKNENNSLKEKIETVENEIETLNHKINYQKAIINKIPKFLLKFIMRNKEIKLLNKGTD